MKKRNHIKLRLEDQIILFKQLHFFLKSGAALDECLNLSIAGLSHKNPKRRLLELVQTDVGAGIPFFRSIRQRTHSLQYSLYSLIEAGEESGSLVRTLDQVARELVKADASRKKLVSALAYPACIALLAIVLIGGMTFGIFPKIRPLLESMHTTLPLPTRVLIFISDFCQAHWLSLIVEVSVLALLILSISRIVFVKRLCSNRGGQLLLKIPMLKKMLQHRILGVFSGTLSTLTAAGFPLPISLRRARPGNIVYAEAVEQARQHIEAGQTISKSLSPYKHLFPEIMIQLISAAESSGSLAETLSFLSDYFQNEYEELIKKWSSLLEPALMVLMGCGVGFIALAMILPIYALSQSISNVH